MRNITALVQIESCSKCKFAMRGETDYSDASNPCYVLHCVLKTKTGIVNIEEISTDSQGRKIVTPEWVKNNTPENVIGRYNLDTTVAMLEIPDWCPIYFNKNKFFAELRAKDSLIEKSEEILDNVAKSVLNGDFTKLISIRSKSTGQLNENLPCCAFCKQFARTADTINHRAGCVVRLALDWKKVTDIANKKNDMLNRHIEML